MVPYIMNDHAATFLLSDGPRTVRNDNRFWEDILSAIKIDDTTAVLALVDRATQVKKFASSHPDVEFTGVALLYKGSPINNALSDRIISMIQEGFNAKPLVNFLVKVEQNPSNRAVQELYKFLESNTLPITDSGNFLAYKRVQANFLDVFSGTIDNSVGQTVSMERNRVNDDPSETCSHGLHVASLGYLRNYSGDRLVAVEVNPAHVVAVPHDYQNTKMRVCEYTVVAELDITKHLDVDAWNRSVYNYTSAEDEYEDDDDSEWEEDDDIDNCYN